jgi:membrane-associated phospholipid phosphatase
MTSPPTKSDHPVRTWSEQNHPCVLISLIFVSLSAFVLLLWAVQSNVVAGLDLAVHAWVRGHRTPWLTEVARGVTVLGSTMTLTVATLLTMAVLLWLRGRRAAVDPAIAGILGFVAMSVVKNMLDRPRPLPADHLVVVTDPSFPSGHACGITALVMVVACHTLGLVTSRAWRVALAVSYGIIILAVGWSRIYLGVHYFSDVAAGFCLGVTCAATALALGMRRSGSLPSTGA